MFRTVFAVLLALIVALPALAPPAEACHNSVRHKTDKDVSQVRRAEKALRAGRYQEAIKRAASIQRTDAALKTRATRVLAVATIRSKGTLARNLRANTVKNTDVQKRNVQWAIQALKHMLQKRDKPATKMHLAEGLALLPNTRDDALKLLDELDDKGLIVDGVGYALLAELRRETGDLDGSGAALINCRRIAHDTQICDDVLRTDG